MHTKDDLSYSSSYNKNKLFLFIIIRRDHGSTTQKLIITFMSKEISTFTKLSFWPSYTYYIWYYARLWIWLVCVQRQKPRMTKFTRRTQPKKSMGGIKIVETSGSLHGHIVDSIIYYYRLIYELLAWMLHLKSCATTQQKWCKRLEILMGV